MLFIRLSPNVGSRAQRGANEAEYVMPIMRYDCDVIGLPERRVTPPRFGG
jgi:hypothetical protein